MKQSQMGEHISEIRKTKGYTKSEPAEERNIDIRTIQRIETGEVTPRLFTLRIINEKLGTDFDLNGNSNDKLTKLTKSIIKPGWIAGFVLICLTPVMFLEAFRFIRTDRIALILPLLLILVYVSFQVISVIFFYRSLVHYGKIIKNLILPIGAIFTIVIVGIYSIPKIVGIYADFSFLIRSNAIFGGFFGVGSIILGIGFILEKACFKNLAISIGFTQLLAGTFYVFTGIIGIGLGAAALILETIFLINVEGLIKK